MVRRSELLHLLRDTFRWTSMDGRTWHIDTMESDHMLNVAKMLYNEVAERLNLPAVHKTPNGLRSSVARDERKVQIILMLWDELKTRNDLVGKDQRIFNDLERQLFSLINRTTALGMNDGRIALGLLN